MGQTNRLAAILVAGSLLVGSLPALAKDTVVDGRQLTVNHRTAATPDISLTIDIPTIDAVGSSIDGETLKAILAGRAPERLADLAALTATSIRIPEIRVLMKGGVAATTAGGSNEIAYTYKGVDIESVKAGVAQSITIASGNSSAPGFGMAFGKIAVTGLDVGGLLAFYGLVPGSSDAPLKPLYGDISLASANLTGPQFACTIGTIEGGTFKARPLKLPFTELMAMITSPEFKSSAPPPAMVSKFVGFYIDMLDAFQTSPMTVRGVDCAGKNEQSRPVAVKLGPLTIGGWGNGRYPSLDLSGLEITTPDGHMSFGQLSSKSFDLSGPMATLKAAVAADTLTEEWFTAHARELIPAYAGFSLGDVSIDVPNAKVPGQRIAASLGDFDLTLDNYLAGVPTKVSTSAHHFRFTVPPAVAGYDDQMDGLRQVGIKNLDLGFELAAHRDGDAKTVIVDKAAVEGADLGTIAMSGVIGNAVDSLVTGDARTAMAAAMALTVRSLRLDAVDGGLGDIIFRQLGQKQGLDLPTARSRMSGVAQGVLLAGLGGTPAAKALGDAVGKFLAGAKSISVAATANNPDGLTEVDFASAKTDPAGFSGKLTVEATAK